MAGPSPRDVERQVAIALGANLGDRQATLERAVTCLVRDIGALVGRSRWHVTEAVIHPDDDATSYPPFLNGVVRLRSTLAPETILAGLHAIERVLGRERGSIDRPWRPRLIDLDLIALDQLVIERPGLSVPHPGMHERAFVLLPLLEVWPEWRHPVLGKSVRQLAADLRA